MAARMKDIAEALGISQTTVSHVLRGRDKEFRINAGTARLVRATAARLDYRPPAMRVGLGVSALSLLAAAALALRSRRAPAEVTA